MSIVSVPRGLEVPPFNVERHRVETNTVALYQLNNGLTDQGPNSLDLTESGTVPYDLFGAVGRVAELVSRLDDSNYVTQTSNILLLKLDLTIMAMVRLDSIGSAKQVLVLHAAFGSTEPTNAAYEFDIDASGHVFFRNQSGAGVNHDLPGTTVLNTGQWYHIAVTRNGLTGNTILYVDGVSDATGTLTLPTGGDDGDFRMGRGIGTSVDLRGNLGSVHILDRELSGAEILAEANRLLPSWQV